MPTASATATTAPRLKALFASQYQKELQAELKLDNIHQVPYLEKIVVSVGMGKHKEDKRFQEIVTNTLTKVTGQAPTKRLAKKSIAGFKIRAGMGAPIGALVTLRGAQI
jgi:large subunit ribosomal protein L5